MENSITGAVRQAIVITKSQTMKSRTYFTSYRHPRPAIFAIYHDSPRNGRGVTCLISSRLLFFSHLCDILAKKNSIQLIEIKV